MRRIGIITTSRADYGIYRPVLKAITEHPELEPLLFVSGTHLSPEFGMTIDEIERDGFPIAERIEALLASDSPEGVAKTMGLTTLGFAQAYARTPVDLLLALGDRTEMLAAVSAALPFRIPVAHIHGGESTLGAIDDAARHAITKLSHLHFPSTEEYAHTLQQLGEAEWRITTSGAPGLDNVVGFEPLPADEFTRRFNLPLDPDDPPLLVTFHPVTMEYERGGAYIDELLAALDELNLPVLFTYPNADTAGRVIIRAIDRYLEQHADAHAAVSLGTQGYFTLLASSRAMIGNSSSGIIEAAGFELPVVNIGRRQEGRARGKNVIDCSPDRTAILNAIKRAVSEEFRASLRGMMNPYGDGRAAERITGKLADVQLNGDLLLKPLHR